MGLCVHIRDTRGPLRPHMWHLRTSTSTYATCTRKWQRKMQRHPGLLNCTLNRECECCKRLACLWFQEPCTRVGWLWQQHPVRRSVLCRCAAVCGCFWYEFVCWHAGTNMLDRHTKETHSHRSVICYWNRHKYTQIHTHIHTKSVLTLVSFAILTAFSSVLKTQIGAKGPKVSSWKGRILVVTWVKTVGSKKFPSLCVSMCKCVRMCVYVRVICVYPRMGHIHT